MASLTLGRIFSTSAWGRGITCTDTSSPTRRAAAALRVTVTAAFAAALFNAFYGLLMAWVLTLPAAILLSGSLYWLFTNLF